MANPPKQPVKANPSKAVTKQAQPVNFLFHRENYIIWFTGIALIAIGYMLMAGGHQPPHQFKEDEIYSFRRITLAPIVVVAGYLTVLYAIVRKPKH